MSHPIPTRTYEDDVMAWYEKLPAERQAELWDEYLEDCRQMDIKPSLSDFFIFLEERLA